MAKTKFPAKIGPCIDLAYTLRAERIEYQREMEAKLDEMKAAEQAINDHIISTFGKSEIEGAKGSLAAASVLHRDHPRIADFPEFVKWVEKNEAFDLFERRIAKKAWQERSEAGQKIAGVEVFHEVSLSLTKVGGKK